MHEGRLADQVAATLGRLGLEPSNVIVRVRGGHGRPDAFDAAFRLHLAAALDVPDIDELRIEHLPSRHMCSHCLEAFDAIGDQAPCPRCGSCGIAIPVREEVELLSSPGRAGSSAPGPAGG
jgi:hypothetical protein